MYKIEKNDISEMLRSLLKATINLIVTSDVPDMENERCKITLTERALKQRKL